MCTRPCNKPGGAVPFWRRRVCKAQKTPFFSVAVTQRPLFFLQLHVLSPKDPMIFYIFLSPNAKFRSPNAKFAHRMPNFAHRMPQIPIFDHWALIFLYFSVTECQKSCSHPMTPHFLSLCSHRMPQPVGARALHPYPFHIWLPPPPG